MITNKEREVIAIFDGWECSGKMNEDLPEQGMMYFKPGRRELLADMAYDSLKWSLPVVYKINRLGFSSIVRNDVTDVNGKNVICYVCKFKLPVIPDLISAHSYEAMEDVIYLAIFYFASWYQQQIIPEGIKGYKSLEEAYRLGKNTTSTTLTMKSSIRLFGVVIKKIMT